MRNSIFWDLKTFNLTFSATILGGVSLFMDNIMLDRMYMFLTLWYYCTLTIRESILRVNGTRIKVGDLKMNIQFQLSIYFLKMLWDAWLIGINNFTHLGMVESSSFCVYDSGRRSSRMAQWRMFSSIQVGIYWIDGLISIIKKHIYMIFRSYTIYKWS